MKNECRIAFTVIWIAMTVICYMVAAVLVEGWKKFAKKKTGR